MAVVVRNPAHGNVYNAAARSSVRPVRAVAREATLKKIKLGRSDLNVTEVALGCMMFGSQNTEKESHEILSAAFDMGVNFLDTAEVYPIPPKAETAELSSKYIGSWIKKSNVKREDMIIATKVAGYMPETMRYVSAARSDPPSEPSECCLDAKNIEAAIDGELRRLGVDYIDLMQTHSPNRYVPSFGETRYDPKRERESVPFEEQIGAMADMIKKGKIRHWGISNETSYGATMICMIADRMNCPRPVTIQNSYSLVDRRFETELAEVCCESNFDIPLLPWSPAAGGVLSGKYLDGQFPEGSRMARLRSRYARLLTGRMAQATEAYTKIAKQYGVSPIQLAYMFCKSQFFVGSTIIGATSIDQLKEDLFSFGQDLPEEALKAIDDVHAQNPNPQDIM